MSGRECRINKLQPSGGEIYRPVALFQATCAILGILLSIVSPGGTDLLSAPHSCGASVRFPGSLVTSINARDR